MRHDAAGTKGPAPRRVVAPLYAAGFTTAFGAHAIAANLGVYTHERGASLLVLGVLLALYDGAEVVLKPVFGVLADRVGARPVLLGGLVAFAVASAGFVVVGDPAWIGAARLGQGAAAAAFSPAAGTLLARLGPPKRAGRAFGSYGMAKGFGYVAGPLLGGALVTVGGFATLFAVLAGLAAAVAVWAAATVPVSPGLPRTRQTLLEVTRRLTAGGFWVPTLCLAATAAALAVGVGYLPVLGVRAGLSPVETGGAVSLLALATALVQPLAGRARDAARVSDTAGMTLGLLVAAVGLCLAALGPVVPSLFVAALVVGCGIGVSTPLGFAALATHAPRDRLGQTIGFAEVGRELGETGGPLLLAGLATAVTLPGGLIALAVLLTTTAVTTLTTAPATTGTD